MSSAAENQRALPIPARGALRLLLPALLSLAILAAMIVSGIRQNRARLEAHTDRLRDSVAILERFRDGAAEFLRREQNADGSWSYHRGSSPSLTAARALPDLSSTERILLNLRRAGLEGEAFYEAGRRFVEHRAGERDAAGSALLASLLLDPKGASRETSERLLRAREPGEGLGFHSLADDLLRLGVLPPNGAAAAELQASIRKRLNSSPRSAAEWLALGYMAWLASEPGSPASRSLLPGFVEGFRLRARRSPWDDLDTLVLASYVGILGEECLSRPDPCAEGNEPLSMLVGRRRLDGSWPAGVLPEADGGYGGSAAETTSTALSALATFQRILEARARPR